jgi:pilus assembly protein CpaE
MFTAKAQMSDKVAGYEAGVDIYLTKPVHPLELQANIKALLSQRRSRAAALLEQGYMLGVLSAKGGLGVSTLALNLAISYHKKYNTPVIAAELRPCQGSWAQELNLANSEGLTKLLQLNPYEITVNSVGEQLVRTPYDVNLLLASCAPCDAAYLSATDQIETILQQLPQLAPFVVVDIGTNFLPAYDKVVEACNEIILVTEPQPMAVRRTRVLLDDLRKKGYGSSKILTLVIYNRARADMSLNMTQIEEILGQPVALGIPPATEQAYSAAMRSIPILLVQPEGLLAQQFTKLAELVHQHLP